MIVLTRAYHGNCDLEIPKNKMPGPTEPSTEFTPNKAAFHKDGTKAL